MYIVIFIAPIKLQWFNASVQEYVIRFIISYPLGCIIFILTDKYYTKEGERYTEMLNEYKKRNKYKK